MATLTMLQSISGTAVLGCHASVGKAQPAPRPRQPLGVVASKDWADEVGTAVLSAGMAQRERYIASNRFKTQKSKGPAFEKRWTERKSRLAQLDGFRYFTLLRRVYAEGQTKDEEKDFDYLSFTVWEDKKSFSAWRNGEAFKEAHGGGSLWGFLSVLVSSTFVLKGAPKPAFYDVLFPITTPPDASSQPEVQNGWRTIKSDGVNPLPGECLVVMNRFAIAPGQEPAFEERWAKRESKLREMPGFRHFFIMRRDAKEADDGFNYISTTIWKDRASFDNWRTSTQFSQAHGAGSKPDGQGAPAAAQGRPAGAQGPPAGAQGPPGSSMFLAPPSLAMYEGVLVLESAKGA
eukprot:jgi/Mesvir1/23143/Mv10531-RA.1